jgi:light-regulated signal transduction histidine kinase (bacteriophytochrome)
MGFLIDDLLNFSRIGRKPMSPSLINMGSLATEAIDELIDNEAVIRDGIRIHTLPDIRGDASMIKQVWVNLLSNAIKYSRNTPDPQIEIGCLKGNSNDVFYVRDNGIGFDMKYSDKLFNVFQRLHNSTEFEGTGVGLALAHRIITRHEGKIWVDAEPDKGATFFFTIPHY